jgi:hypothetical protein
VDQLGWNVLLDWLLSEWKLDRKKIYPALCASLKWRHFE